MKALIGIKKGMTRVFKDDKVVPVTVIDTKGCVLSHIEPEGFELGIGVKKNPNKAMEGKYEAVGKVPVLREYFKGSLAEEIKPGDEIKSDVFVVGDKVSVVGVSKGKGFQGVVKRWGFKGGPKTHGQSDRLRAPGSIGNTDLQRVALGRKMAGRMGQEKIIVKNLEIVAVDPKKNILMIKGAVPGRKGTVIEIQNSFKI